ncbi:hypothetical protein [Psychroserpens sp.]|uniref:hypothetical protein n=1 Tax=Psychroserpens sp. TaxID=2020870 RepID=UPI0039E54ABC
MKTNLAPKHIRNIDDTFLLWFKTSNRYAIVSNRIWTLISLFLSTNNRRFFLIELKRILNIGDTESDNYFDEISSFLDDLNSHIPDNVEPVKSITIPKANCVKFYKFMNTAVKVNFESSLIAQIIHPQIAHHNSSSFSTNYEEFDIFKSKDHLYLYKNKSYIGHYKTETFHFLQGRFALELTNTIHKTFINNWIATFHASTVTNGEESIMIVGDSGNGKSTLSALLMASGFDLLSDDFTPMYEDTHLYRYPSAISIKKGAFDTLESKIPGFNTLETLTNGPKKINIKYLPQDKDLPTAGSNFICKKIVLVKFDMTKSSKLLPISVEKILETLIPDSWISPNEEHALKFMNWLSRIECFELSYSDNDFAIRKFKELF